MEKQMSDYFDCTFLNIVYFSIGFIFVFTCYSIYNCNKESSLEDDYCCDQDLYEEEH